MMDFEVLKTKTAYVMQVRGKWYEVPHGLRNQNRTKLMVRFEKGEFKELKQRP